MVNGKRCRLKMDKLYEENFHRHQSFWCLIKEKSKYNSNKLIYSSICAKDFAMSTMMFVHHEWREMFTFRIRLTCYMRSWTDGVSFDWNLMFSVIHDDFDNRILSLHAATQQSVQSIRNEALWMASISTDWFIFTSQQESYQLYRYFIVCSFTLKIAQVVFRPDCRFIHHRNFFPCYMTIGGVHQWYHVHSLFQFR